MTLTSNTPTVNLDRWPAMATPQPASARAFVARRLLARVARRTGVHVIGDGLDVGSADGPVMTVLDADAFLTRIARDGKIGFGESYMAGDWDAPDLVAVLTPMARQLARLVPPKLQWLRSFYDARHPGEEDNDPGGARRNIARHYDLSNQLFSLFLDDTMTYSAALFDSADEPLADAQARKIDRLLDLARVKPGTKLLEIGTGWGELALRAGRRGAQVTTATLSVEQAELARQRLAAAHLSSSVDVRVQDYREVTGRYDAIVSVEMIEAVGAKWWPTYFRTLEDLLAPGGTIGLQTILMPHDRMLASQRSWTWIHKYIFPGGQIPSTTAIEEVLARHTNLRVSDRLHFGASYADTLQAWRQRFLAHTREVDAAGFDETFRRMWTFYLAYCEAGFRADYLDVAQIVMTRNRHGR